MLKSCIHLIINWYQNGDQFWNATANTYSTKASLKLVESFTTLDSLYLQASEFGFMKTLTAERFLFLSCHWKGKVAECDLQSLVLFLAEWKRINSDRFMLCWRFFAYFSNSIQALPIVLERESYLWRHFCSFLVVYGDFWLMLDKFYSGVFHYDKEMKIGLMDRT